MVRIRYRTGMVRIRYRTDLVRYGGGECPTPAARPWISPSGSCTRAREGRFAVCKVLYYNML